MDNRLIAYCGVDCSVCPDLKSGKCAGCRNTDWKEGSICLPVECCRKRGIDFCGQCEQFPCPDMKEFYRESPSHEQAYALMLSIRAEKEVQ